MLVVLVKVIVGLWLLHVATVLLPLPAGAYQVLVRVWRPLRLEGAKRHGLRRLAPREERAGRVSKALELRSEVLASSARDRSFTLPLDQARVAWLLGQLGRKDEALQLLRRAKEMQFSFFTRKARPVIVLSIADLEVDLGEPESAQESLAEFEATVKPGDETRSVALAINHALVLTKLGQLDRATSVYRKLLDMKRVPPMVRVVALNNLADACIKKGDWESAEPYIAAAEQMLESDPGSVALASVLGTRGEIELHRGDVSAAELRFQESSRLRNETPGTGPTAWPTLMLARVAIRKGELNRAHELINDGGPLAYDAASREALRAATTELWKAEGSKGPMPALSGPLSESGSPGSVPEVVQPGSAGPIQPGSYPWARVVLLFVVMIPAALLILFVPSGAINTGTSTSTPSWGVPVLAIAALVLVAMMRRFRRR